MKRMLLVLMGILALHGTALAETISGRVQSVDPEGNAMILVPTGEYLIGSKLRPMIEMSDIFRIVGLWIWILERKRPQEILAARSFVSVRNPNPKSKMRLREYYHRIIR